MTPEHPQPQNAHRLFSISEMIGEVFTWLSPGQDMPWDETTRKQRTLARAARVCKAFHDPALDVLWRYLRHRQLWKFMQLYASDSDKGRKYEHEYYVRTDSAPPPQFEPLSDQWWERMLVYSRRIRTLVYSVDWDGLDFQMHVAAELSAHQGRLLFPFLNSLDWGQPNVDGSVLAAFLLHSPAIRCFTVRNRDWGSPFSPHLCLFATILRELQPAAPTLHQLSLPCLPVANARYYDLLAGLSSLRSLECHIVSLPMLQCLCRLENLAVLNIRLYHFPSEDFGNVCFRAVHSLSVHAEMSVIIYFLRGVTCPVLESLELRDIPTTPQDLSTLFPPSNAYDNLCFNSVLRLTIRAPMKTTNYLLQIMTYPVVASLSLSNLNCAEGWEECRGCLTALSALLTPNLALRAFSLDFHYKHWPKYNEKVFLLPLIRPLFDFPQLEEVAISGFRASLSDDDLCTLASSWPGLRALALTGGGGGGGAIPPSIHALAEFSRFPALHSLSLRAIVIPSDPGRVPAVCESVRHLNVFHHGLPPHSKFAKRPILAARFLHGMFPNAAFTTQGCRDVWEEVQEAWAALRAGQDVREPGDVDY